MRAVQWFLRDLSELYVNLDVLEVHAERAEGRRRERGEFWV